MLERLSPWEYHEVRTRARATAAASTRPAGEQLRRLAPSLWDAFTALLERRGLELSDVYVRERAAPRPYDLAEALIEFDERIAIWRSVHVKMVQRVIGGGADRHPGDARRGARRHDHEGALPRSSGQSATGSRRSPAAREPAGSGHAARVSAAP